MTVSRYRIWDTTQPHFLTCTILDWLPVFTRPEAVAIVLDSWRYLQSHSRLQIYGYVVMENHLHFVASSKADLGKQVKEFKSYTARKIIDFLQLRGDTTMLDRLQRLKSPERIQSEHQLWQEGSHPKQILDEDMMIQKLEYTHNNPVRRGYVDYPEDWRYSSARNYSGRPGLIDVTIDWR